MHLNDITTNKFIYFLLNLIKPSKVNIFYDNIIP